VMIPKSNVENLMLKHEVVAAVKEGKFHIWAVSSIDEGIGILTGQPAGKRLKDGSFTKRSVHDLVDKRLEELNRSLSKNTDTTD
ncbi:MAG: hypothetical protein OEM04_06390, partial [Flavobacteriaceae bacterium]|nr:hypothetical protein [Flavobacteriaceae bacterium]